MTQTIYRENPQQHTKVASFVACWSLVLSSAFWSVGAFAAPPPGAISQTANDQVGESSITQSTNWPNATDPSPGNDYQSSLYLRSNATATFAGDSLTMLSGGILVFDTDAITLTVNDADPTYGGLHLYGGRVAVDGSSGATDVTLAGDLYLDFDGMNSVADGGLGADDTLRITADIGGIGQLLTDAAPGGKVLLSGANTFTGGISIKEGAWMEQVGASSLHGDGAAVLGDGESSVDGVLRLNHYASLAALSGGASGLIQNISGGSISFKMGSSTLADTTFNGVIDDSTGNIAVTKVGANRQILTNAQQYSGGTSIQDGQLQLSGTTADLGSAYVAVTGIGTLELDGIGDSGTGSDLTNEFGLMGRLDANTAHIDNVGGTSELSGPILLDRGGHNYNIDSSAGDLTISGYVFALGDPGTQLNLGGAGTGTISGDMYLGSFGANINKSGTGTWTLGGSSNASQVNVGAGTLVYDSTSIAGSASIASGATLEQGVAHALDGKAIAVDGTLDLGGFNGAGQETTLPGLNGGSTGHVINGGVLVINGDGDFAGTIEGTTTALTMDGAGKTQILRGNNTYGGDTNITDGILKLVDGGTLGGGTVTIGGSSSGTLQLDHADVGAVTLEGRTGPNGTLHIENLDGSNTVGAVTLAQDSSGTVNPDYYYLKVTGGAMDIASVTADSGGLDSPRLELLGTSATAVGSVSSAVKMTGSSGARIDQLGGTWNLDGGVEDIGTINASSSGVLTIAGVENTGSGGLTLGGTGHGAVGDVTVDTNQAVNKNGAGTWGIGGTVSGADNLNVNAGTLAIGSGTDISGVTKIKVAGGATLDADAVAGFAVGVGSAQTLVGKGSGTSNEGAVIGYTTLGGMGELYIGADELGDIATLTMGDGENGNGAGTTVTLADDSILHIEINPASGLADLLEVVGNIAIEDLATVEFLYTSGTLDGPAYKFVSYSGGWNGGEFGTVFNLPANYIIDYDYEGNWIALIKSNAAPAPGPLALIGLGGVVMGAMRRYRKR